MKAVLISLLLIGLSAAAYAQTPNRGDAAQIWKVSHPESGSEVTEVRAGAVTLEFPYGPIISRRNIDLPPVKEQGSWTLWTIDAFVTLKAKMVLPAAAKPSKRAGGSWKLFALLKDGRVVEARKNMYGTNLISYRGDGQIEQHYFAKFALLT